MLNNLPAKKTITKALNFREECKTWLKLLALDINEFRQFFYLQSSGTENS